MLRDGVKRITTAARISPSQILATCIGAAGAARTDVAVKISAILADLSLRNVEVVGDTLIALEAAFCSGPGVIAISGTGSIVYGRDASGHTARAGGWGFAVSDEGSGHWIGKKAISAILSAHDEDRHTLLSNLIFKSWHLRSVDDLVQEANSTPQPDFPRVFPLVLRAAEQGDEVAEDLLREAGVKLAALVATVLRRLDPQSAADQNIAAERKASLPVATTGSVFRQSSRVRETFKASLRATFPGIVVHREIAEPINGALSRARAYASASR